MCSVVPKSEHKIGASKLLFLRLKKNCVSTYIHSSTHMCVCMYSHMHIHPHSFLVCVGHSLLV